MKQILTHILRDQKAEGELSVFFVEDEEMSRLNAKFRGRKGPTDVLAFPSPQVNPEIALLGDIVVSVPMAIRQAKEQGHPVDDEVAFLLIHGALHLLGYDHQSSRQRKKMFHKQEMFLEQMKEK